MSEEDIEFYTTKDTITCEECNHVNIVKIKNVSSRKKKAHMVYCDSITWLKIKKESADFNTIGNFLAFIIKFYEAHRERFNVV
jgi:hypothetical protein